MNIDQALIVAISPSDSDRDQMRAALEVLAIEVTRARRQPVPVRGTHCVCCHTPLIDGLCANCDC